MSLFEDNAIFTGIIVLATLNPFLRTVNESSYAFSPLTLSSHHFSFVRVIYHREEASFALARRRSLPGSAASPPHKARQALVPPSQWPLVSVMPPTVCVPFTLSQLPVMGRCAGIMYRMLRAVPELILHTTSLIPH